MDAAVTIDVLPATMCSQFRALAASVIFADRSTPTMLPAPSRSQTSEIVTPWPQPDSSRSSGWTARHPTAHAQTPCSRGARLSARDVHAWPSVGFEPEVDAARPPLALGASTVRMRKRATMAETDAFLTP